MPRIQAGSDGRGLQIISRVLRNIARYKKTRHSEKDFALLELERDTDIPACEAQNLITLKRAESAVVIGAGMEAAANYEHVRDLGFGTFGVAKLMRKLDTGELVAVKLLPRGSLVNDYVEREIMNHRSLQHPHIIAFKEAFLTPTHLAIVMEYAIGGELFDYLTRVRRFSENEARYFFQQLISGLEHCHSQGICHRDLKLENLLLDGSKAPRLKICDFGYSKHQRFDSGPKSMVGTGAYIAPEVIVSRVTTQTDPSRSVYDGKAADVWSAGVVLYLLLVGRYPFEDPLNPTAFDLTIRRIMAARYEVPPGLGLSPECHDLLARMLVVTPQHRITLPSIMRHPFFLRNLPRELLEARDISPSATPLAAPPSNGVTALHGGGNNGPQIPPSFQ